MGGLRSNPVLRGLRRTLDAEGIRYTVGHGGKHPYIHFEISGRPVRLPFPASTGDLRSHRNASAQVRRIIRTARENV